MSAFPVFGSKIPFSEPQWYTGFKTPYYKQTHVDFRAKVREWAEKALQPYTDEWEEAQDYPRSLHEDAYKVVGSIIFRWNFSFSFFLDSFLFPSNFSILCFFSPSLLLLSVFFSLFKAGVYGAIWPKEYGGTPPEDFDMFHELIYWDELARCGSGGVLAACFLTVKIGKIFLFSDFVAFLSVFFFFWSFFLLKKGKKKDHRNRKKKEGKQRNKQDFFSFLLSLLFCSFRFVLLFF